jgi:phosphoribosylformylglycinamidine (FGAM) synthase-like amidotransferase family enzyme
LLNHCSEKKKKKKKKRKKVYEVQKMVLGVCNPQSVACEVGALAS